MQQHLGAASQSLWTAMLYSDKQTLRMTKTRTRHQRSANLDVVNVDYPQNYYHLDYLVLVDHQANQMETPLVLDLLLKTN